MARLVKRAPVTASHIVVASVSHEVKEAQLMDSRREQVLLRMSNIFGLDYVYYLGFRLKYDQQARKFS